MTGHLSPKLIAEEEASRIIVAEIRAYPLGGDKREEHLRLYGDLLPPEEIEGLWAERYAEIARIEEAKPKVAYRRFAKREQSSANAEQSFSVLATQPAADEEAKDTKAKAAEVIRRNFGGVASALPIATARAKPEEEHDEEAQAPKWTTANRSGAQLSKTTPLDTAKLFAQDRLEFTDGKSRALGTWFYQDKWWQWNGAFYEKAPEQRLIDMACDYLDNAKIKSDEGSTIRFKPTTKDLSSLITFLRSNVGIDDRLTPPKWLDNRPSPSPAELLAFRNCLVDATTGKTYFHDPRLWLHDGVDFNYDPAALCPTWEWFLKELFPTDDEAREVIEQFLGYGMTLDNQFEKAVLWIGPPRSGRGTIASILERLVGSNGYTSLNMHTWRGENSRQGMVGKRVGIFHDIRLRPGQWYGDKYDPGGVDPHSQQLLLELISGDLTEIGRKYLEAWKGLPFLKFLLISNKVPNFNDETLITRFITIEFQKSYLNKERPEIKKRQLPAEIAGIAARCVAAYGRLLRQGYFIQPTSGLALLNKVKATVNPWQAFMDFYWEVDPTGEGTRCRVFYLAFKHWCLQTRRLDIMETSPSDLIQKINQSDDWEFLESFRPEDKTNKKRPRRYPVRLKPRATLPEEILNIPEPTYE